jgi:hypothetical protein
MVKHQMTAYDLTMLPEFGDLQPKQAAFTLAFVQGFIDTGRWNRTAAVNFSYPKSNEDSARTFGYQLAKHEKIRKLVKRFLDSRRAK